MEYINFPGIGLEFKINKILFEYGSIKIYPKPPISLSSQKYKSVLYTKHKRYEAQRAILFMFI